MDFMEILEDIIDGQTVNPYAGKSNGEWVEGSISVDFLNKHFSQYSTAEEMQNATESESLTLFQQL